MGENCVLPAESLKQMKLYGNRAITPQSEEIPDKPSEQTRYQSKPAEERF